MEIQKDNTTNGTVTTMAHELVARDEQSVGIFFSSVAIQYFLHKDMIQSKINPPEFIKFFADIEIYGSQRVFIKNLISNKNYAKVLDEMRSLFMECDKSPDKHSYTLFLARINKSFLIRQIFRHTDQVLDKYNFIDKFVNPDINNINMDELYKSMWLLPVEQQILILTRVFISIQDTMDTKKKNILLSFAENVARVQDEIKRNPSRHQPIEISNVVNFGKFIVTIQKK